MRSTLILALLALTACKGDKGANDTGAIGGDGTGGDDTGDGTGDGGTVTNCTAYVVDSSPAVGETSVYWKDTLSVKFSEDAEKQAKISLLDGTSAEVTSVVTWENNGIDAIVNHADLGGSSDYTLRVDLCGDLVDIGFQTSKFGTAMTVDAADLVGNTYFFDLSKAEYVQPPTLGAIVGNYLAPLLFGVSEANSSSIHFIGTQGEVDDLSGEIQQTSGIAIWDFGTGDFTDAPYFEATTSSIAIEYDSSTVVIYDFYLEGTFAPDASSIGGGIATGMADTSELGPLIGLGSDPNAVCDTIGAMGIDCEECPQVGTITCVPLEAHFLTSDLVSGLVLDTSG